MRLIARRRLRACAGFVFALALTSAQISRCVISVTGGGPRPAGTPAECRARLLSLFAQRILLAIKSSAIAANVLARFRCSAGRLRSCSLRGSFPLRIKIKPTPCLLLGSLRVLLAVLGNGAPST